MNRETAVLLRKVKNMANEEHVALLRTVARLRLEIDMKTGAVSSNEGGRLWNEWREKNPTVQPDLRGANFSGAELGNADLVGADLSGANLREVDLTGGHLRKVNLAGADLT